MLRTHISGVSRRFAATGKIFLVVGQALVSLPVGGLATPSSRLEHEVLKQMNVARTDPGSLIPDLQKRLSRFEGKRYRPSGSNRFIVTQEGPAAVKEAIDFLERQNPLPPFSWAEELARSAAELVRAQGASGGTGHGTGNLALQARIERHLKWTGRIAENVSYGPDDAREVVLQMIVDDGVPDRSHRETIFSPPLRLAGVACGPHPTFRTVCVIDFAAGVAE